MNQESFTQQTMACAIIVPAAECGLTIEEIAAKDVPEGKPFKIVDVVDIPTDRTFRNAWEYFQNDYHQH
jgi:hypothetical protein